MDNIDRLIKGLDSQSPSWWQKFASQQQLVVLVDRPEHPTFTGNLNSLKRTLAMDLYMVLRAAFCEGLVLPGPNEKPLRQPSTHV